MRKVEKVFRGFLYVLPVVLYFSYYPVISLGSNETMNFEFSLPLLWLVAFDLFSFGLFFKDKLWKSLGKKWVWLLFPGFLSLSVLWSPNKIRGILTVGILWLIYFAVFSFYEYREILFNKDFRKKFLRVFFISSLAICFWCFLQCILDLAGVARGTTLMCEGCTYKSFGFPHPNGLAIEPQFMGNLLLAPVLVSLCMIISKKDEKVFSKWVIYVLFFVFSVTLFLTFSRGAIYAMIIGVAGLMIYEIVKSRKAKVLIIPCISILAFLFTLNLQGIFAQVSKTNDTYLSGISKVIEQLSLGIIKMPKNDENKIFEHNVMFEKDNVMISDDEVIINEEAIFDGYVEESTNVRLELSRVAIEAWASDAKIFFVGTGIGGAGISLYEKGLIEWPKEIIQNEYINILLETGIIGFSLFILTIILLIRFMAKKVNAPLLISLVVAYGVTLLFFSGLVNVLHIYLLSSVFSGMEMRKKLVS